MAKYFIILLFSPIKKFIMKAVAFLFIREISKNFLFYYSYRSQREGLRWRFQNKTVFIFFTRYQKFVIFKFKNYFKRKYAKVYFTPNQKRLKFETIFKKFRNWSQFCKIQKKNKMSDKRRENNSKHMSLLRKRLSKITSF